MLKLSTPVINLPAAHVSSTRLVEAGVRDANRAWRSGRDRYIENVLEIARHVHQVWQACETNKISFRSLFREDAEIGFEFSREQANKYLAIGRNQALVSGSHETQLPQDYNTLAKLAQIPAPKLSKLIETEKVTPNMRRADVAVLINGTAKPAKKQKVAQRKANTDLDQAYEALRLILIRMPRDRMLDLLQSLINDCGAAELLK